MIVPIGWWVLERGLPADGRVAGSVIPSLRP